jgi:hypothetical protein
MDVSLEGVLTSEIKKINKEVPLIHRGGCGVFAVLLWDMLAFHDVYTQPVEVFDGYPIWERNHILLKYNSKYIDSLGIHDNTYWMGFSVEHKLRLDELKARAWNEDYWLKGSNSFNRDDILRLKQMIHQLGYAIGENKKRIQVNNLLNI